MLIKSSMETLELAYDAVNMVYKNLLNQPGQMYNKWFIKNGYGQDNAYIMAEHTDYSVRMFFTFTDTGFVYVEGYFTNGSSYDRKNITSWKFDNDEYPFEETTNHVKQVLDNFFDEGINVLRGEEVYNSRKSIKSATSKELKEAIAGLNDIEDEFALVDYVKKILKKNGMSNKVKAFCDETDKADTPEELGKVAEKYIRMAIKSSRRTIKSSADNLPSEVYYMVVQGAKMYYSTDYDKVAEMVQKINSEPGPRVYGPYTEDDPDEIRELYEVGYIGNSHKSVKSSDDKPWKGKKWDIYYPAGSGIEEPYVTDDFDEAMRFRQEGFKVKPHKESEPVKSSTTWVAGKSENGNKSFYCEDGKFYAEEDYGRPSIKVFNNKDDAEKIAKRSKSGFIQILDDYDD